MWRLLLIVLITTPANNIPNYIRECNPRVTDKEVTRICTAVNKYSKEYSVPQDLIVSVIAVESNFKNTAGGLMQVRPHIWMPELRKNNVVQTKKELKTVHGNIKAGAYILRHYKLNVRKYNGGGDKHYSKKVKKHALRIAKRIPKRKPNKVVVDVRTEVRVQVLK